VYCSIAETVAHQRISITFVSGDFVDCVLICMFQFSAQKLKSKYYAICKYVCWGTILFQDASLKVRSYIAGSTLSLTIVLYSSLMQDTGLAIIIPCSATICTWPPNHMILYLRPHAKLLPINQTFTTVIIQRRPCCDCSENHKIVMWVL
jgi:hypothetical protein